MKSFLIAELASDDEKCVQNNHDNTFSRPVPIEPDPMQTSLYCSDSIKFSIPCQKSPQPTLPTFIGSLSEYFDPPSQRSFQCTQVPVLQEQPHSKHPTFVIDKRISFLPLSSSPPKMIEKPKKMRRQKSLETDYQFVVNEGKKMVPMGGIKRRTGKSLAGDEMLMKFTFV
jgi:hypothetical protein